MTILCCSKQGRCTFFISWLTCALFPSNKVHTWTWPSCSAIDRRDAPSLFCSLTHALFSSSKVKTLTQPLNVATCRVVQPKIFWILTNAPLFNKVALISHFLLEDAKIRGAFPFSSRASTLPLVNLYFNWSTWSDLTVSSKSVKQKQSSWSN